MVSVSFSSQRMVPTCEHVNSTPPSTCPQLAGSSGAQGYPSSPGTPVPRSTMLKDPKTSITSTKAASRDELKLGPVEVPKTKAHFQAEAPPHLRGHHQRTVTHWHLLPPFGQVLLPSSPAPAPPALLLLHQPPSDTYAGQGTNWRKFRVPNVCFLLKDYRILSSDTKN
jgi:hypothetical protein